MGLERENRILRLAVERGLIFEAELEGLGEAEGSGSGAVAGTCGPRIAELIREGRLDERAVAELQREVEERERQSSRETHASEVVDPSRLDPLTSIPPSAPGGQIIPADEPVVQPCRRGKRFGKYELGVLLGEGAMGEVYQAYDAVLKRPVALKFLHVENLMSVIRLFQEARAQARVEHEAVCRIYEAGKIDDEPFIAMQYVAGTTLDEVASEMTLEEKLTVMKQVAEGVHAAHRIGLIHRDLKPGNILVQRTDEGQWKPYVMDFGLARETQAAGVTQTGVVMGTIAYMSPEQARGEIHKLDRRTDIYSLGATLYELLSGKPPFSETTGLDIIVDILGKEVTPLRTLHPHVPADVDTIVLKCLEKAPERRYDSAKALADDLQRYIDGEPVLARPASLTYRLAKRIRKNKAVAGVVAVASVLVLFSSGAGLHARWVASERARMAQEFGIQAKGIESMMRNVYMLPLHDVGAQKEMVRDRMKEIQGRVQGPAQLGYGPANYALGCAALALHEDEAARAYLEKSWDSGYRNANTAAALGLAFGYLYQQALEEASHIADPELRESRLETIRQTYRTPALSYLKIGSTAPDQNPAYVRGLVAFCEQHYEEASQEAERATREIPWMYEARKLQGDVELALGMNEQDSGDYDRAAQHYDRAGAFYRSAISVARSDASLYVGDCKRWNQLMEIAGSPDAENQAFAHAVQACDEALTADSRNSLAYIEKARIYHRRGEYEYLHGADPTPFLTQAIQFGQEAIRWNSSDADAFLKVGNAYYEWGEYLGSRGSDPSRVLGQAIECYEKATSFNPSFIRAFNNAGNSYRALGEYEESHGRDPRRSFAHAIEQFETAIRIDSKLSQPHGNLGTIYLDRADYEREQGMDPSASLESAIRCYKDAVQINPRTSFVSGYLGEAYRGQAECAMDVKHDPGPLLELSREELKKANALDPTYFETYYHESKVELSAARWDIERGSSALAHLRQAEELVLKALRMDSEYPEVYECAAKLYLRWAEWELSQKRPVEGHVREGLSMADKALGIDPKWARALAIRGSLHYVSSLSRQDRSTRMRAAQQAIDDLQRALVLNQNLQHDYGGLLSKVHALVNGG